MNYGDKHTEDSLVSRLGRLYGIERGLDCGPNIIWTGIGRYGTAENGKTCTRGTTKLTSFTLQKVIISTKSRLKSVFLILEQTNTKISITTIQTLKAYTISFRMSFIANMRMKLRLRAGKKVQA